MTDVEFERKIDLACIFLFPAGLLIFFVLARLGYATGEYGDTYIAATHIVIAMLVAIIPAIRYTRKLVFPYWFVIIITLNIYAYGIPLFLGFYDNFWWWDEFAHWMSTLLVSMVVFVALCLIQCFGGRTDMPTGILCFLTFIGGFAFGNVWELMEGTIDWLFGGDYMQHHMADSLEDIHMDFLGALTMGIVGFILLKRKSPEDIVASMDEKHIIYNATHHHEK